MIRPEEMNIHVDSAKLPENAKSEKPVKFSEEEFGKKFTTDFLNLSADEYKKILNRLDGKDTDIDIKFNPAIYNRASSSMALAEARQREFVIINIDKKFYKVKGTQLSDEFFARNGGKFVGWVVSDIASGAAIEWHLKTLADCKKFVEEMSDELKARIEERRQTPVYKEVAEKIKELDLEDLDTYEVKESLKLSLSEVFDVLDEVDQMSLFDL